MFSWLSRESLRDRIRGMIGSASHFGKGAEGSVLDDERGLGCCNKFRSQHSSSSARKRGVK